MSSRKSESWQDQALCSTLKDTDTWLQEAFYADTTAERLAAKRHCGDCPVRLQCLSEALDNGEIWGVWGGCDEVDLRRALWLDTNGSERERRRFPRCPACHARTESLFVRSTCQMKPGSPISKAVECGACGFSWAAATSVVAIEIFWAAQEAVAPVIPITRKVRVSVPRGKIPSGPAKRTWRPVVPPGLQEVSEQAVTALVASGKSDQQQR